jgi:hypothetical protein
LESEVRANSPVELVEWSGCSEEFLASKSSEDGKRAIVADQAVRGKDETPGPKTPVSKPVPTNVEDDDPVSGHPGHLAEQTVKTLAMEVVGELHGDDKVDRTIVERDVQRVPSNNFEVSPARRGNGRGVSIEGDDLKVEPGLNRPNRLRDIAGTRTNVKDRDLRGNREGENFEEEAEEFEADSPEVPELLVDPSEDAISIFDLGRRKARSVHEFGVVSALRCPGPNH